MRPVEIGSVVLHVPDVVAQPLNRPGPTEILVTCLAVRDSEVLRLARLLRPAVDDIVLPANAPRDQPRREAPHPRERFVEPGVDRVAREVRRERAVPADGALEGRVGPVDRERDLPLPHVPGARQPHREAPARLPVLLLQFRWRDPHEGVAREDRVVAVEIRRASHRSGDGPWRLGEAGHGRCVGLRCCVLHPSTQELALLEAVLGGALPVYDLLELALAVAPRGFLGSERSSRAGQVVVVQPRLEGALVCLLELPCPGHAPSERSHGTHRQHHRRSACCGSAPS
mmetsp:Transcript_60421/g.143603  ORF Transcript_60421/g.143603 Transcript_60421/m.143603 type:complete len:285 (+) Transcript_60421:184-1038(+)